ncbi:hypothetical protein [Azospirillum sp. A29]|uniref:hypothetical protein n=1 Tax=unclassified Azospirillum TaxID=2630922 RepID=UPI00366CB25D
MNNRLLTALLATYLFFSLTQSKAQSPSVRQGIPLPTSDIDDLNKMFQKSGSPQWTLWEGRISHEVPWNGDDIVAKYTFSTNPSTSICFASIKNNSSNGNFKYGFPIGTYAKAYGNGNETVNAIEASNSRVVAVWVGKSGSFTNRIRSWLDLTVLVITIPGKLDESQRAFCKNKMDENMKKYDYSHIGNNKSGILSFVTISRPIIDFGNPKDPERVKVLNEVCKNMGKEPDCGKPGRTR